MRIYCVEPRLNHLREVSFFINRRSLKPPQVSQRIRPVSQIAKSELALQRVRMEIVRTEVT